MNVSGCVARSSKPVRTTDRLIGRCGRASGPLLVCLAGIHGNEPAGMHALQRVFRTLSHGRLPMAGMLVGFAGNLAALAEGKRYLEQDLNRIWLPERIAAVKKEHLGTIEDGELKGLLDAIHTECDARATPMYCLDMHTTSVSSAPFAITSDTIRNRKFGLAFGIPLILGIEERLGGTVADYVYNLGLTTVGLESGSHDAPESVDRHEAAVWVALHASGVIPKVVPEIEQARKTLSKASPNLPRILEVRYRHRVGRNDGFRMFPGFANFQPIRRKQPLARDRIGEVRSPESGRILMPLYQELGDDGFLLAREVRFFWLSLSSVLRRLRLDHLVHKLPGVRRHPQHEEYLLVNPGVARWFTAELFHLLGFRRYKSDGPEWIFRRRRYDHPPR